MEKLKEDAKNERSYARTKVKRGALNESDLAQTITVIDGKRDAAIAALWQAYGRPSIRA